MYNYDGVYNVTISVYGKGSVPGVLTVKTIGGALVSDESNLNVENGKYVFKLSGNISYPGLGTISGVDKNQDAMFSPSLWSFTEPAGFVSASWVKVKVKDKSFHANITGIRSASTALAEDELPADLIESIA